MKEDIVVKNGIIIPAHELEITASRSGGAGGQHVNKTSTRITLRWNIPRTQALDEQQKQRVFTKLQSELTTEGDLIIHSSTYRSQQQNRKAALDILAQKIRNALHVPKKRMKSKLPQQAKEVRLEKKKKHSEVKKMRRKVEY